MSVYSGFDLHDKDTVYIVQDDDGNVRDQGKAPTTVKGLCDLVDTLELPKGTKIGLETGAQVTPWA